MFQRMIQKRGQNTYVQDPIEEIDSVSNNVSLTDAKTTVQETYLSIQPKNNSNHNRANRVSR